MQIHTLQTSSDSVYSEPDFITILESHLSYLKQTNVRAVSVSEHQGYKYEGDLYGLLSDLGVNKNFHYITMRINGYEHSGDYKGDRSFMLLPDFTIIDQLKTVYKTKNS